MGIRSRLGVTAASLALVSMVMAACGSSSHKAATSATGAAPTTAASSKDSAAWSAIEAAAKKEGKVTWYAVAIDPANIPQMQAAFKAKYPEISIDIIRGLPADTRAKAEAEATSGKGIADVVSDSSPAWLTKGENKVIKTGLDLPNFKATGYKADQWLHDNAYYLWTASGIGFAWNTKLDPNGAKTPDDFLNPALKGKVGVLDPTTNSYFVDYYKHMEDVWGADWVAKVASQNPKIYASAVPIA